MMAESKVNSCLEAITVPCVKDLTTDDYTEVDKSYFEKDHVSLESYAEENYREKMEPSAEENNHEEMEPAAEEIMPMQMVTRRRSRATIAADKKASVSSATKTRASGRLRRNAKIALSNPDMRSPLRKRQRKHLGDLSNSSMESIQPITAETPRVLRRGLEQRERAKMRIKTTEKIIEEQIEAEKEKAKMILAKSKESHAKAKASKPAERKRGAPATQPEEFKFATDSRVKEAKKVDEETKNFVESLRKSDKETFKLPKSGRTVVQPFNLRENKRKREVEDYKSLAEQIQQFSNPSYRSSETDSAASNQDYSSRLPTIAHTPNFSKRARRPGHIESAKEIEEKEIQEAKKNRVKAHPVNKRILRNAVPLKEVEKRPPTKLEPFHITDEKHKKEKPLEKQQEEKKIAARTGATQVEPFSFAQRDEHRRKMKEQKIKEELENEKKLREFKASKMPILDEPKGIPQVNAKEPTKPEPFNLHEGNSKSNNATMEEEKHVFHARPATVLKKEPFIAKPSDLPPVVADKAFRLHTDERSEEREKYEMERKKNEAEIMASKKQKEEEQQRLEEEDIKQQRAATVHHAQPVHHYKPVEIQHGLRPLTKAVSPKFSDRFTK